MQKKVPTEPEIEDQQEIEKILRSETFSYENRKSKWSNVLGFLTTKLKLKKQLTNWFIFKPPKPGYFFEQVPKLNTGENSYKIYMKNNKYGNIELNLKYSHIQISSYLLSFQNQNQKEVIPLVKLSNERAYKDYLIIYSHGNASDLRESSQLILNLSNLYHFDFLTYDYRGYGISTKSQMSEHTIYEDLEYVLSFAVHHLKYQLNKIILWGFSMGSCPTIEIASRYQNIGGVILQSPLASLLTWLDKKTVWNQEYSNADIFCNINKIEHIQCKIFIMHGKKDNIINVRHSHLLFDRYLKSKENNNSIWMVLAHSAGHNDLQLLIENIKSEFYKRLTKFFVQIRYSTQKITKQNWEAYKFQYYERENQSLKISYSNLVINEEFSSQQKQSQEVEKIQQINQKEKQEISSQLVQDNANISKKKQQSQQSQQKIQQQKQNNEKNVIDGKQIKVNQLSDENLYNNNNQQSKQESSSKFKKKKNNNDNIQNMNKIMLEGSPAKITIEENYIMFKDYVNQNIHQNSEIMRNSFIKHYDFINESDFSTQSTKEKFSY